MKILGDRGLEFPETEAECRVWTTEVRRVALGRDVLCVARTRMEGKWGAYCGAVPGKNHDDEESEVLRSGCKMLEGVARVLFPCFDGIPYAK